MPAFGEEREVERDLPQNVERNRAEVSSAHEAAAMRKPSQQYADADREQVREGDRKRIRRSAEPGSDRGEPERRDQQRNEQRERWNHEVERERDQIRATLAQTLADQLRCVLAQGREVAVLPTLALGARSLATFGEHA